MEKYRIAAGDIKLGEPVQWDVYDEHGALLLSRGHIVQTPHQLEGLIERGMHVDLQDFHAKPQSNKSIQPVAKVKELPSIVRLLDQCNKQLEKLLFGLHLETHAEAKFIDIAKVLIHAVQLHPEIALAYILLNDETKNYTIRHSIDTAMVALRVAQAMEQNPPTLISLVAAALTMNLGMLRQHNALQTKSGALTPAESEIIKHHPQESVRILQERGITDQDWLACILHHHEQEDGSGYPFGKKGDDCPLNSKIIMLADLYCAGVTGRSYRKPLLPSTVLKGLFVEGRKAIDHRLAPYFVQEITLYPPGSCVRLQNGEIAVVTRRGKTPSTPIAHAYIGPRGAPLTFPIPRDTSKTLFRVQAAIAIDDAPLPFTMQQLWGAEAAS